MMTEEEKPKRIRKHNPAWQDPGKPERNKTTLRQRRTALNEIARLHGWQSWHVYETAVIKSEVGIDDFRKVE